MPSFSKKQLFFFIGLLAIFLVYMLYNIYLVEPTYYLDIPRRIRHINRFVSILLVYGAGTWALKKYTVRWMMQIWHLSYILITVSLLGLGLYDWRFGMASAQIRNIAASLHEFLISPILYVAMGIINNRLSK